MAPRSCCAACNGSWRARAFEAGDVPACRQFPAAEPLDFPLSEPASHYYKSGSPFLQRCLRFWMATLTSDDLHERIDRLEVRANTMRTPTTYAHMLYTLRVHVRLVRERIEKLAKAS